MKSKFLFLIFGGGVSLFFAITSCKKQDQCVAGTGGYIMVAVFPKYNGRAVYNLQDYRDTAYMKFNSQSLPGTKPSDFNLVVAGNAGEDHVHLPNLKCGDYFVYVTGMDTVEHQRVTGGIAISITPSNSSIDLDVQMTK